MGKSVPDKGQTPQSLEAETENTMSPRGQAGSFWASSYLPDRQGSTPEIQRPLVAKP